MKNFLLFVVCIVSSIISNAQSFDEIGKLLDSKKFAEAKIGIDKF